MALRYKSILETLSQLVDGGKTGMLVIYGRFDFKARIYLRAGCVFHAECGHQFGAHAIRSIAKRKAVMTLFVPDRGPDTVTRTRFSTDEVLYCFKQADRVWDILHKTISSYDAVFELAKGAQYDSVEQTHRIVLSALDGCRTVHQVIRDTGIAEMDVLHILFFYSGVGLIRRWDFEEGEPSNSCRKFIGKLREELRRSMPSSMLPMVAPPFPDRRLNPGPVDSFRRYLLQGPATPRRSSLFWAQRFAVDRHHTVIDEQSLFP